MDDMYLNTDDSDDAMDVGDDDDYVDKAADKVVIDNGHNNHEFMTHGHPITYPPCRKPLVSPGGSSPMLDIFILAAMLNQGVRFVNPANADAFVIYDFKRYFEFCQSLPDQQLRHGKVTPVNRLKALRVWLSGDMGKDVMTCVARGVSHSCRTMKTLDSQKKKMNDRYKQMLVFIKQFL